VDTGAVLDLPPLMPSGLAVQMSTGSGSSALAAHSLNPKLNSSVTLSWNSVTSKIDGSAFNITAATPSWVISSYNVYMATGIAHPAWVSVATLPVTATSLATTLPEPGQVYYYRIDAVDSYQAATDASMIVDTLGNIYALGQDQITRLTIPASFTSMLAASGNTYGKPLLLRAADVPGDLSFGGVMKSVTFSVAQSPNNAAAPNFQLPGADAQVSLGYDVSGGNVVASVAGQPYTPSSLATSGVPVAISAANAAQGLAMYWNAGSQYVPLYGQVDTANQIVQVNAASTGNYQIRAIARDSSANFDISGLTNKAITPNNPNGLNTMATFLYQNPNGSAVNGKIFDIRGMFISDMVETANSTQSGYLQWDAKANGRVVPGGIYIYQIQAEGKTWTGTLVVIR
jgi:hypothetical protein